MEVQRIYNTNQTPFFRITRMDEKLSEIKDGGWWDINRKAGVLRDIQKKSHFCPVQILIYRYLATD